MRIAAGEMRKRPRSGAPRQAVIMPLRRRMAGDRMRMTVEARAARVARLARAEPGRTLDSMIRQRMRMAILPPISWRLPCHHFLQAGAGGGSGEAGRAARWITTGAGGRRLGWSICKGGFI